jgi:Tfp pilus tip-associated adhesin PilY1
MKKLNLLLSSLLLVFTFNVEAKSPPPGTGKADVPANIYIMLDNSGSMGWAVSSSGRAEYPWDVVVDSSGNTYFTEQRHHRIKKYNSANKLVRTISSSGTSNGRVRYPTMLATDSNDNIYVIDSNQNSGSSRVQKFNTDGTWLKTYTGFTGIVAIAIDSSDNLYAANRSQIRKWNSSGTLLSTTSAGSNIYGMTAYGGSIYVLARSSYQIRKYSEALTLQNTFNLTGNSNPDDLTVTSNGIYVTNRYSGKIQQYNPNGSYKKTFGTYGTGVGQFRYSYGIGSDSSGNIYNTGYYENRVLQFDSDGVYKADIGEPVKTGMTEAKKVLKKLLSNSDMTRGANFGLQMWNSRATQREKVSTTGATNIFNQIVANSSWFNTGGGTNLDTAMDEAKSYFLGGASPINKQAGCQKNFLMVISDGVWRDTRASKIAKELYDKKGIETFVIGFLGSGGSNYVKIAKAGGTYPDSPLYSNNWQHLYDTLSSYIRQAISSRLTFSAPVIMPNISSGDHIFQSTFTYKQYHQWEGQLSKYKLDSSGSGAFTASVGALKWEASAKLNALSDANRKVWTIANSYGLNTSLNNFTTSNFAILKNALWDGSGSSPTDSEAKKLISFVRGFDSYDENANNNTTERRHKLGDIYNSKLAVVGKPSAKTSALPAKANTEAYYRNQKGYANFKNGATCGGSCQNRKEIVYVGANDGMLHAFDSITGEELWAFIPPMMLKNLRSMISAKANSTNAIYGVDGSPIVKDIYYGGKWRTVLISGMGKGGYGYFALDITNASAPTFLFAFENNPTDKVVYRWDSSGARTELGYSGGSIAAEYDYSKLGESMSTPVIVALPVSGSSDRKWVAAFGGGYNSGVNTDYGSSIYVIDLEDNGKVIKRIDLNDVANNNIANAMPAHFVSITPDTTSKANYKGSMIFGVDLEGKQWQLNLTDKGTLYEITRNFDAEATLKNDREVFFQETPSISNTGELWNFFGTGNQQRLQLISSDIDNRIYGLKDKNFPTFKNVTSLNNTESSLKNVSVAGSSCPTPSDNGWYVKLNANERVTGKLAVFNEILYATRYKPNSGNVCSPGTASLSEHAYTCGSTARTTTLGQGIATGAVVHKGIVYIGISGEGSGDIKDKDGKVIGKKKDNIILLKPSGSGSVGNGTITQESWREIY